MRQRCAGVAEEAQWIGSRRRQVRWRAGMCQSSSVNSDTKNRSEPCRSGAQMIIRVDLPREEEAHSMVWKGCSLWELLLVRMVERV